MSHFVEVVAKPLRDCMITQRPDNFGSFSTTGRFEGASSTSVRGYFA